MHSIIPTPVYITLAAVVGAGLVWVIAIVYRIRSMRRSAARAPYDKQVEWRGQCLGALVELVGRDTARSTSLGRLNKRLDWDRGRYFLILDYLTEKGLVARSAWGGDNEFLSAFLSMFGGERVKPTIAGLDEFDRAQRGPTEHLPHIDNRGIIIIGSRNTTASVVNYGVDAEELAQWMSMYRFALEESAALSDASHAHVEELLEQIQEAMGEGDLRRVRRDGQTLRSIAEGVVGNAAWAALVTSAKHLGF